MRIISVRTPHISTIIPIEIYVDIERESVIYLPVNLVEELAISSLKWKKNNPKEGVYFDIFSGSAMFM